MADFSINVNNYLGSITIDLSGILNKIRSNKGIVRDVDSATTHIRFLLALLQSPAGDSLIPQSEAAVRLLRVPNAVAAEVAPEITQPQPYERAVASVYNNLFRMDIRDFPVTVDLLSHTLLLGHCADYCSENNVFHLLTDIPVADIPTDTEEAERCYKLVLGSITADGIDDTKEVMSSLLRYVYTVMISWMPLLREISFDGSNLTNGSNNYESNSEYICKEIFILIAEVLRKCDPAVVDHLFLPNGRPLQT